MKCFKSAQNNLKVVGIDSNHCRFNKKMLMTFLSYGINNILNFMFLFYGASNSREYTDSMYVTCCTVVIGLCYTIAVFKMKDLFKYIEGCENLIEKSK